MESGRSGCDQRRVAGLQTVIYLVGVPYDQFASHPPLMQKTLAGVTAAGVERFILIGTVYPYGRARGNPISENHPREPHTFKGKMRLEQEKLVLAAHGRNGLSTLVLRLPDFYGQYRRSLINGVFEGAAHGKRAQVIGPVDVPHEFIYLPDIGPVVENSHVRPKRMAAGGTSPARARSHSAKWRDRPMRWQAANLS